MPGLLPDLAALVLAALVGRSTPADSGVRLAPSPTPPPAAEGATFNGRLGQLDVRPPRLDGPAAAVTIDGTLDEPAWHSAARLTGFSRFQPDDGAAASDSTEVLVWHSPTAIHFGVRAFAPPGTVNATLGDRDRVLADDYVTILLSTFDDARQAVAFGVNPLGVQMDGTLVETGSTASGGFTTNSGAAAREAIDLSADFVFQSRGRVTPWGYEVEVRIPFKTLRYQSAPVQRWGVHVLRRVQRLGVEDSWAPARRGAASFLAQGGHLTGLTDLRRGLVLDLTPSVTQRTSGTPPTPVEAGVPNPGWTYRAGRPEPGGTVRWGVTNNLTLNGTVRPDFSQVEADAAQVQFDPRQALYFPERRPFFLDGIEQFAVPNGLIYTRRIVQPSAAAKLSGKVAGTDVALLTAVDDPGAGPDVRGAARRPVYAIARVQRDLGAQSRAGFVFTSRDSGRTSNRLAGLDARLVFRGVYTATAQLVGSATRDDLGAASGGGTPGSGTPGGATRVGPLAQAALDRNGRRFGFRYTFYGVGEDFVAGAGFISRPGITRTAATHRVTFFPGARSPFLSLGGNVVVDGTWKSRAFAAGGQPLEEKVHVNTNYQLRGGWTAGASVLVERFRYDPDLYAGYYVARPGSGAAAGDTVPYVGTPVLPNRDWVLSLNTPQFRRFSANVLAIWGRDENFYEWQSSDILFVNGGVTVRPSGRLRLDGTYALQRFARPSDGSVVGARQIPRLRAEYQVARPVFVRFVGQYVAARQDSLRDDGRTNGAVFRRRADGTFLRLGAQRSNTFRGDVLFSYQPTPGTVFFAGYGETMTEPDALRLRDLARTADGFFIKASYLFRL